MAENKKGRPIKKETEVKGNIVKFNVDVIQKFEGGVWKAGKEYEISDIKRIELITSMGWGVLISNAEEPIIEAKNSEETEIKE